MSTDRAGRAAVAIGVAACMVGVIWASNAVRDAGAGRDGSQLAALFDDRRLRSAAGPAERMEQLQQRLRVADGDPGAWAALAAAYLDQARRTADPRWYPKAEESLDRALGLAPGNVAGLVGRSALAAARHDFEAALDWAERAGTVAPGDPAVLGVLGDALIELGRYPEAFETYQAMVDRRPDLASYARVAYARELQGDLDGAEAAFREAQRAASNPADDAFTRYHLGELAWNRGQVDLAVDHYRQASRLDPDFVPAAAALARAALAQGRADEAIEGYRAVVERTPLPVYVAELGDLHARAGRPDLAAEQYELVAVQEALAQANGVNTSLEAALFSADHRVRLDDGLAGARREWSRRRSIFVADALAWQLHVHGRHAEAFALADQALALGTRNPSFLYHRSKILDALGRGAEARRDLEAAVALNPHFSILFGPAARGAITAGAPG